MTSKTTLNVEVNVETSYLDNLSNPSTGQHLFSYTITIKNNNNFSIQLLTRHWKIVDSLSPAQYVDGEGVVGEQPILIPNESYSYQSYCELFSTIGYMEGTYLFRKEEQHSFIEIAIPKFTLELPTQLN